MLIAFAQNLLSSAYYRLNDCFSRNTPLPISRWTAQYGKYSVESVIETVAGGRDSVVTARQRREIERRIQAVVSHSTNLPLENWKQTYGAESVERVVYWLNHDGLGLSFIPEDVQAIENKIKEIHQRSMPKEQPDPPAVQAESVKKTPVEKIKEQIQREFGTTEGFDDLVDRCFSSYKDLDPDFIILVYQRSLLGRQACQKALDAMKMDCPNAAHQPLPNAVFTAVQDQIQFDRYRIKLEKLNLYRRLKTQLENDSNNTKLLEEIGKRIKYLEKEVFTIPSLEEGCFAPIEDLSPPASFFQNYLVYPLGFEEEDAIGINTGKWVVVDLSDMPEEERDAVKNGVTKKQLQEALESVRDPGDVGTFHFVNGSLIKNPKGSIQIFYELAPTVLQMNEDIDFGVRKRLRREGFFERGSMVRVAKDPGSGQKHWTSIRQRTAAVDRLEAIWLERRVMQKMLQGHEMNSKSALHFSEFQDGIRVSDLATLTKSYSEDPVFNDSVHRWGQICQPLRALNQDRTEVSILRGEIEVNREKEVHLPRALMAIAEVYRYVCSWQKDIDTTLAIIDKNPGLFGRLEWYVGQLRAAKEKMGALLTRLAPLRVVYKEMPDKTLGSKKSEAELSLLDCEEAIQKVLPEFREIVKILQVLIYQLAVASTSKALEHQRNKIVNEIGEKHPTECHGLRTVFDNAFNSFYTILSRIELPLDPLKGRLPLSLRLVYIDALSQVKNAVADAEAMRGRLSKQAMAKYQNPASAVRFYFTPDKGGIFPEMPKALCLEFPQID